MNETQSRPTLPSWTFSLWLAVMFFVFAGFSVRSIASGIVLLIFTGAFWFAETRSERPRKSFYRLGLASALLLIFLIDVSWQGSWILASITWLGITVLALIGTAYYERTEALR